MTHTNQQDVVKAKEKIAELKSDYMDAVSNYISTSKSDNKENFLAKLLDCQKKGNAYFNYVEEFVGNSDLLGAHNSSLWAQGFAEDCAEHLGSLIQHITLLKLGFTKHSDVKPSFLGETAYANMQRMVVTYLSPKVANKIRKNLETAGLPIYGFKNEAKEFMSKKLQTIFAFAFGTVFVIVLIVIAFIEPNPSSFQYTIFRVVLALAGGGAVAVFPGFIEVKFGNWLRAGGALAVFTIVYFYNPASLNESTQSEPLVIKKIVNTP